MQRFLETERGCAVVGDDQFEAELLSELGAEEQMIIAEPGFPGGIVRDAGEGHGYVVIRVSDAFQLPGFCAHQSVRRGVRVFRAGREPRKTDGYAATNCCAILPLRFRTYIEHFFASGRLPRSDVCAVQVNFTRGSG